MIKQETLSEMSEFNTPVLKKARPASDMSFSPEMDSYESLSKLFDDKLKPLHEKVDKVLGAADLQNIQSEMESLRTENKFLKERLDKLENYSRKKNIRIYNIKETKDENLDEFLVHVINKQLNPLNSQFSNRTFENVHRIGKPRKEGSRVVVARFNNYKDKLLVNKIKPQLKKCEEISVSDDFSTAVEEKRSKLFPVCKAIQQRKKQLGQDSKKVYLKMDQLCVDGKSYGVDNLESLPAYLKPENLFTPTQDGITAFFTKNSPLSNHYSCKMRVNGEAYNCMEQYLMIAKAKLFDDQQCIVKIHRTKDPVEQKS